MTPEDRCTVLQMQLDEMTEAHATESRIAQKRGEELDALRARVAALEAALRGLVEWVDAAESMTSILCDYPEEKMAAARAALAPRSERREGACPRCGGTGLFVDHPASVPCPECAPPAAPKEEEE